ncbi:3',5'-cyclic AMP phosphodiesterase CpdA [Tistlia consotensis]|uniref:3',5'-cyclic AMP phosphodiesterase CpdA n=1 Tax=Tistlia consotensis USBA 355 TaxID=560819 RepID=A0A1Y6CPU4_9PROT|nr:metallophosphoesterase [Tistlia consotensis]SMF69301.1 3',5'-cyclic AMP phosphodiesterase CpdA [Tistlia consotensis USBA 355]SNS02115.1 3',5'-cyclic AMP phosphodiesterase CpdA [Tistlia consotensis]
MRLLAISDLHLANPSNREAVEALPAFPDDWLILAGDIAERLDQIESLFALLAPRFAKVIWVPGNHELWTMPGESGAGDLAGEAKYRALVALARNHGVVTPEDPYPLWTGPGGPCVVAPLFLLYDYSFRPDHVARHEVVAWAREESAVCTDEVLLNPDPHDTREAWCWARCAEAERRLSEIEEGLPTVLVNHYPLRHELVRIPRVPRFSPWCGTRLTEDWHRRFNAKVVVYGHLHVRRTDWRDGTRFEEVSLGYPRQWNRSLGVAPFLREILPGPSAG